MVAIVYLLPGNYQYQNTYPRSCVRAARLGVLGAVSGASLSGRTEHTHVKVLTAKTIANGIARLCPWLSKLKAIALSMTVKATDGV